MMFPKPQSGLVWPSIVVFNANNNGGVHFWIFGFFGALRTHKMAIKPAKMAILGPNLKNAVPKTSEWAKLTQYCSFQCQQPWWGPFFIFWGPTDPKSGHKTRQNGYFGVPGTMVKFSCDSIPKYHLHHHSQLCR